MFKATADSIKRTIQSIGEEQQWGMVSLNQSSTAVAFLNAVAKADDMEAKALELKAQAENTLATSFDMQTQGRMKFVINKLNNLFA